MKRKIGIINVVNIVLSFILIISFIAVVNIEGSCYNAYSKNEQLTTYLKSNYLEKVVNVERTELQLDSEIEVNKELDSKIVVNKQSIEKNKEEEKIEKEKKIEKEQTPAKNKQTTSKKEIESKEDAVLEKLTGALAGYGPDCAGCTSFRTASGRYIGEGKIYYEDKEYGTVRIVAGDKSYPFGTIVKITNTNYGDNSPIYAIVLDRGGGVGKGKKFLFDLLFETEKQAAQAGSRKDVTFEILRLGY